MRNYKNPTSLNNIKTLSRQSGKSMLSVIKVLSNISCEKKIKHYLKDTSSLEYSQQKVELYYRQKSKFAQIKILDNLKTRLIGEGIEATFLTEFSTIIGRYDIIIVGGLGKAVRIEIKAGFGINLKQLDRYLLWHIPLILVRIPTGNVIRIDPKQLKPYILFSLRGLEAKAERLLSGRIYTVPGFDCWSCTCFECPYNKGRLQNSLKRLSDEEFEEDLMLFFKNLPYVAEKVAKLVIEELKLPSQRQKSSTTEDLQIVEKHYS